ncbi:acyl carrier protein [Saccharomonospora xinjiangensis]|uniref:Acyl carrier protein n=1 Tax=Saccharomonospora cyanea NA-134 TaxID=882082 RepID=H5XI83_9PSEU|nr:MULTISPECIES: acyl carrier protein [Saccharomonospora]EHR61711.1 acyl carrier protein [Saccharomonospora cyanea NA-134]QBQ60775.1 Meromycolate extension acyl carrier protein [Saccharomonospora xinjiangensis]
MTDVDERKAELRELVADVLEIEPEELTDHGDFAEDYDGDSLRAIEMLARIERKYKVEIPQQELATMRNFDSVFTVAANYAGWRV